MSSTTTSRKIRNTAGARRPRIHGTTTSNVGVSVTLIITLGTILNGEYRIGFTGTQDGMTPFQKKELAIFFWDRASIYPDISFHHGVCEGADEEAAQLSLYFGFTTIAHPPINTYKMSDFESDFAHPPKDFLDRNKDIVDDCDVLVATPKEMEEVVRSGTWSTVRYARRIGRTVHLILPKEEAL